MKHIKKFNEGINNEHEIIDGSGLFFWNSNLNNDKKLEIINWYKNLSEIDRKYVDILRDEAKDDAYFSCNEDESI